MARPRGITRTFGLYLFSRGSRWEIPRQTDSCRPQDLAGGHRVAAWASSRSTRASVDAGICRTPSVSGTSDPGARTWRSSGASLDRVINAVAISTVGAAGFSRDRPSVIKRIATTPLMKSSGTKFDARSSRIAELNPTVAPDVVPVERQVTLASFSEVLLDLRARWYTRASSKGVQRDFQGCSGTLRDACGRVVTG